MADSEATDERIPPAVLAEQWFGLMHRLIEAMQKQFRNSGLTQHDIARRIGKAPAFISRCLSGQQNMTMRTLHDIARALGCRVEVSLVPLAELPMANRRPYPPSATAVADYDEPPGGGIGCNNSRSGLLMPRAFKSIHSQAAGCIRPLLTVISNAITRACSPSRKCG